MHLSQQQVSKKLWFNFLKNNELETCDGLVLVGDSVDVMVGACSEYLQDYEYFFRGLKEYITRGKKVFYVEGNHDFHVSKILKKASRVFEFDLSCLERVRDKKVLRVADHKVLITHGDLYFDEDRIASAYQTVIRSALVEKLVEDIVPYKFIQKVASKLKDNSARRKQGHDFDQSEHLQRFREIATQIRGDENYIIMGHSHLKDEFYGDGFVYLNVGYPPLQREFLVIEDCGHRWVKIEESSA